MHLGIHLYRIISIKGKSLTMKFVPGNRNKLFRDFDGAKQVATNQTQGYQRLNMTLSQGYAKAPEFNAYKPILLREMTVDHVHERCQLICYTIKTPFRMTGLMIIGEDNNGDAVTLAFYNYKVNSDPETSVPLGTIFSIKNPYLRKFTSGDVGIRVDDPNTIVEIASDDPLLSRIGWNRPRLGKVLNAIDYKMQGNELYKNSKYNDAIDMYTRGLNLDPNLLALKNNRAASYMATEFFGLAIQDLKDILIKEPTNQKAIFRLAKCYFYTQKYVQLEKSLNKLSNLLGNTPDVKDLKRKLEMALVEKNSGNYNLQQMYIESEKQIQLYHADYRGPVEVVDGVLVATEDIEFDQLIMANKALAIGKESKDNHSYSINWDLKTVDAGSIFVIKQLAWTKCKDPHFKSLFSKMPGANAHSKLTKEVVDAICTAECISTHNNPPSSGLFTLPSFRTHSCLPNSSHYFIGDFIFVKSTRAIEKGQVITISFSNSLESLAKRQKFLRSYKITCVCELCTLDAKMTSKYTSYESWIENMNDLPKDKENWRKCLENLNDLNSDVGRFRRAQLLMHTLDTNGMNANEVIKGFRPRAGTVTSVPFYEIALSKAGVHDPTFNMEFENWMDTHYFKGYRVTHTAVKEQ